ncbi:MAG: SDR family oxidoreductase [Rickettsiales bacterium]
MKPTILITGAARRIGAAIAQQLAHEGYNLVLHYRDSKAEAEALAEKLCATPHAPHITLVQADLADTDNLHKIWDGLPPVTHVVHNAASFSREPFGTFTAAQLRAHLAVNFEAPLLLTQGFAAQLPAEAKGSVTVLGDGAFGASISPNFFPYAVSKLAWESVISLLAASVAPRARANVLALGPTLAGAVDDEAMLARVAHASPLQSSGNPAEIAQTVRWLLTQPHITGQTINLASGRGIRPLNA